jgi:hypothetical protein
MGKSVRQGISLLLILFICVLFFPGCGGGGGGGGSSSGAGSSGQSGRIVMDVPFPTAQTAGSVRMRENGGRTVLLSRDIPTNVDHYIIYVYEYGTTTPVVDPVVVSRPASGTEVTVTIDNVPAGWKTVVIYAYDASDVLLAEGTENVYVTIGATATLTVNLVISPTPTPTPTPTVTPTPTPAPWDIAVLDGTGDVGKYCSMAINSANKIMISYYWDKTYGELKYIENSGTWSTPVILDSDSTYNVGTDTSIAYDSSGNPHISYYYSRFASDSVRHQYWDGSSWQTQSFDGSLQQADAGYVGAGTSIALDPLSYKMGISFYMNQTPLFEIGLRVAVSNSLPPWAFSGADTSSSTPYFVGIHSSLKFNQFSNPIVSYYDSTNGNLKFVYYDGSLWWPSAIDTAGNVGDFTSLDSDSSWNHGISYYDVTNGDLKFILYNAATSTWQTPEVVDSTGNVGQFTSLVFDSAGNPMISYYDVTNGDLKLATKSAGVWTIETVDSTGDVGQYSSLRLDTSGRPCICYYDATNGWLKFARKP